jgi:hypothetical protein
MTPENDLKMTPEVDTVVTERPQQFRYTTAIPSLVEKNARLARRFRRTIRPDMLWNPFVLRLTRELERFGLAYEAGKRPKLILSTPPQVGKSMAAEDFAAWMIGRRPVAKLQNTPDVHRCGLLEPQRLMPLRMYWRAHRLLSAPHL